MEKKEKREKTGLTGTKPLKRDLPKGGNQLGTGIYYHRYLRLGGRPGRVPLRTRTEPLPRLQRGVRQILEPRVPTEQILELKEELGSIRQLLQKLESTQ